MLTTPHNLVLAALSLLCLSPIRFHILHVINAKNICFVQVLQPSDLSEDGPQFKLHEKFPHRNIARIPLVSAALVHYLLVRASMLAWDPHVNQIVAVRNVTRNGEVHTLFNPFNFTDEPFLLQITSPQLRGQFYAFNYVAMCVFPTSGLYCPLN